MTTLLAMTVGWLFVHPIQELPGGARLWMLLPLVACVAMVYRGTRVRTARGMARSTLFTFVTIIAGMAAIAAAFYALHMIVRRYF